MAAKGKVTIHPTALVDPGAHIDAGAVIGPYCIVERDVSIGANTQLASHVVVHAGTRLGRDNVVRTGAILGMAPQDLKYEGEHTKLIIGDGNRIGEYCTISLGTGTGRSVTQIGRGNYLMAMVHIGHDCIVGDDVILTQSVSLAGMVIVEDKAVLGGHVGVNQFMRIGRLAMIGAMTKVAADVPPYVLVDGQPAHVRAINAVGLSRHGVDEARRSELKQMFRLVFKSKLGLRDAITAIEADVPRSPEREHLLKFLREARRGICR